MEGLQAELLNLGIALLTAFVGVITKQVVSYLKKKGLIHQLESNKELVRIVVGAVEQSYKTLKGQEKLNYAKMELIELMGKKKIKISEKELDILIESVVKEMNDTVKQEIKK